MPTDGPSRDRAGIIATYEPTARISPPYSYVSEQYLRIMRAILTPCSFIAWATL